MGSTSPTGVYANFIAIEGADGSGKATQTALLYEHITKTHQATQLSFPRYGQASAYFVEQYLNGAYGGVNEVHPDLASLTFALDRLAAKSDILTALQDPEHRVITDRYVASNLAHQGSKIADKQERLDFYTRSLEVEYTLMGLPRPAKNIVLLLPSDFAQVNVDKKATRSYTDKKRDIHEADSTHLDKTRACYVELCEYFPESFIAIDCLSDGKQKPIEAIQEEIRQLLVDR